MIGMKGPPRAGEEDRALVGLDDKRGPGLVEVLLEPCDRALADGNDPVLPALALADGKDAPGEIEIIEPEPDQLHPPEPRGVAHLQDRAVAEPDRRAGLGPAEDLRECGVSKRLPTPVPSHPRNA